MNDDKKLEQPWCCLCGERHAWGTSCDPKRIDELRKQAALVRRLAVIQRRNTARD